MDKVLKIQVGETAKARKFSNGGNYQILSNAKTTTTNNNQEIREES